MMKNKVAILILTLTYSLTFNANVVISQQEQNYEIKEYLDILYLPTSEVKDEDLQRLNLVIPKTKESCPLLIWIGGGAWSYVDRDVEMDFAREMAKHGIAVASVGHRLSAATWKDPKLTDGVTHPAHVEDLSEAVHWLSKHSERYGYNTNQFFIGGYSSGAHLAALIGMDERFLKAHQLSTKIFKGIIPISGTYDINNYYEAMKNGSRPELAELHVEAVFGGDHNSFEEASPYAYLEDLETPILLMCDNNLYNYTRLFEDYIRETEFRNVQVVYAYEFSHSGLWKDLSFNENSTYRSTILFFIKNHK